MQYCMRHAQQLQRSNQSDRVRPRAALSKGRTQNLRPKVERAALEHDAELVVHAGALQRVGRGVRTGVPN